MIRVLIYLVIILAGACLSPLLAGKTGYVYIAFLDWQLETNLLFAVMALIIFFALLQLLEWLLVTMLNLVLSSRYLPRRWRRNAARKHTLTGALALAEEDWPAAEKAMQKGAEAGELPALNYLAAARAAQRQFKNEERDEYLNKAAQLPLATQAVTTTRVRYYMQQGELEKAREQLDKLQPSSKSKAPVLQLALELYQSQLDWQALKLLLPTLRKKQLLDNEEYELLNQRVNNALLAQAALRNEQELEKCWHWLSRQERSQQPNMAQYALGLAGFNRRDDALKLLNKALKKEPCAAVLEVLPKIFEPQDSETLKLLKNLEPKLENHADYQHCMAQIHELCREFSLARAAWERLCHLLPRKEYWLALAKLQEQLADNQGAFKSYKQAAKCN
jgi:HemY protein